MPKLALPVIQYPQFIHPGATMRSNPKRAFMKFVLCAPLLVSAISAASAATTDGLRFTSDDQRISFWAPLAPKRTQDALPSRTGAPYQQTSYAVEGTSYLLLVRILDFRKEDIPTTGDEKGFLDSMLQSMRKGFGAQFVLDADGGTEDITSTPAKLPGRQLKATIQGQRMVIRAFIAPHAIYMQQIGYPQPDKLAAKIGERFLASLMIAPDPEQAGNKEAKP
jgi:hypothetical protein